MAKNYYITLEIHDEGEWPRIAPENLMQHVDIRLPEGLTLAHATVSEIDPARSATLYDPDHLNPAKGGNRAGDDYW